MSGQDDAQLNLLLFSVSGVHFAVDAEQVAEIGAYAGEQSDDLFWFHEELEYGTKAIRYASPTVVSIRTGGDRLCRVIIDAMEDVAAYSLNEIQLFPALLEPYVMRRGLWGILQRNGVLVLLVDFQRLLQHKLPETI